MLVKLANIDGVYKWHMIMQLILLMTVNVRVTKMTKTILVISRNMKSHAKTLRLRTLIGITIVSLF